MCSLNELAYFEAVNAIEQAEIAAQVNRSYHHVNAVADAYEELSDTQFVKLFRLNKSMVDALQDKIQPFMIESLRSSDIDIRTKVLTVLRFFGSGSYQADIGGNKYFCLSQPSVSRCLHEFIDAFNASGFFHECIRFPTTLEELNRIRHSFYTKYGFPGVIGAIDCTHVAIFSPSKEIEYIYVNRKGYHSINTQLICDANLKILSVNARFPGSTHDSFIWNNSNILPVVQELHQNHPNQYYLLGDSGYALRPWLYTPIEDAEHGTPRGNYNESQMSARSIIENTNGVLKMRFRCCFKQRTLHYAPQTASNIINICCSLHNMCIEHNLENVLPEQDDDDPIGDMFNTNDRIDIINVPRTINPLLAQARRYQERLILNYFA